MRILFHSVPPMFRTGYGVQTKLFCRALRDAGHEVAISSVVMIPAKSWEGIDIFPAGPRHNLGNDFIMDHVDRFKPDVVISMTDTFAYQTKKFARLPWVAWQIIDSAPLLNELRQPCNAAKLNLAMSRFGQQTMQAAGYESDFVPLAYDAEEYYRDDQVLARDQLKRDWNQDWGNRYVVMMNASNMSKPSRKNFSCAFKAFADFVKHFQHDALLYCHTELTGHMANGEDLRTMLDLYGLTTDQVVFPPQYEYNMQVLGGDFMRTVYNAADIFLCTSRGEGFCVPLIEAQACGLPVIAPEFSTGELVFDGMQLTGGIRWAYIESTEQVIINPQEVLRALLQTYRQVKAVPQEIERYEIKNVMREYLAPVLKKLQEQPQILRQDAKPEHAHMEENAQSFLKNESRKTGEVRNEETCTTQRHSRSLAQGDPD